MRCHGGALAYADFLAQTATFAGQLVFGGRDCFSNSGVLPAAPDVAGFPVVLPRTAFAHTLPPRPSTFSASSSTLLPPLNASQSYAGLEPEVTVARSPSQLSDTALIHEISRVAEAILSFPDCEGDFPGIAGVDDDEALAGSSDAMSATNEKDPFGAASTPPLAKGEGVPKMFVRKLESLTVSRGARAWFRFVRGAEGHIEERATELTATIHDPNRKPVEAKNLVQAVEKFEA